MICTGLTKQNCCSGILHYWYNRRNEGYRTDDWPALFQSRSIMHRSLRNQCVSMECHI